MPASKAASPSAPSTSWKPQGQHHGSHRDKWQPRPQQLLWPVNNSMANCFHSILTWVRHRTHVILHESKPVIKNQWCPLRGGNILYNWRWLSLIVVDRLKNHAQPILHLNGGVDLFQNHPFAAFVGVFSSNELCLFHCFEVLADGASVYSESLRHSGGWDFAVFTDKLQYCLSSFLSTFLSVFELLNFFWDIL